MTFGVVMLVHSDFDRVEKLVRHWHGGGCPVVVHVDSSVSNEAFNTLKTHLSDMSGVSFCARHRCEWGTWGIVEATLAASEMMLENHPDVTHVFTASGSCLPLRPVPELAGYLLKRPGINFIESATTRDVPWIVNGLSDERFTLRFPFSWRKHRFLFDRYVDFQRRFKYKRKIPAGLVPHMGSQWWCLTAKTLRDILEHPARPTFDNYFKYVWIPDESYFQTIIRSLDCKIESRSLTLSKFDTNGKPHVFYDDHLEILRRSRCFVARKIWPEANVLWDTFLEHSEKNSCGQSDPNPARLVRIFNRTALRRIHGRNGLRMPGRFPSEGMEQSLTSGPYVVFEGFSELFMGFEDWLRSGSDMDVHGHIFSPSGAEFDSDMDSFAGALVRSSKLRDYDAVSFLRNFIWNTRGATNCFQYGPGDCQDVSWGIAKDPNARVRVISGSWLILMFRSGLEFSVIKERAAKMQKIESDHLQILRSPYSKANIKIWSLAEFVESPSEFLLSATDDIMMQRTNRNAEFLPKIRSLDGFSDFLKRLKNEGMPAYLIGDYSMDEPNLETRMSAKRKYSRLK